MADGGVKGSCEECAGGRERLDSDYEWEAGDGDVAGDMVSGVSRCEAYEEGCGDNSGGEDELNGCLGRGRA